TQRKTYPAHEKFRFLTLVKAVAVHFVYPAAGFLKRVGYRKVEGSFIIFQEGFGNREAVVEITAGAPLQTYTARIIAAVGTQAPVFLHFITGVTKDLCCKTVVGNGFVVQNTS